MILSTPVAITKVSNDTFNLLRSLSYDVITPLYGSSLAMLPSIDFAFMRERDGFCPRRYITKKRDLLCLRLQFQLLRAVGLG